MLDAPTTPRPAPPKGEGDRSFYITEGDAAIADSPDWAGTFTFHVPGLRRKRRKAGTKRLITNGHRWRR